MCAATQDCNCFTSLTTSIIAKKKKGLTQLCTYDEAPTEFMNPSQRRSPLIRYALDNELQIVMHETLLKVLTVSRDALSFPTDYIAITALLRYCSVQAA